MYKIKVYRRETFKNRVAEEHNVFISKEYTGDSWVRTGQSISLKEKDVSILIEKLQELQQIEPVNNSLEE